MPYMWQDHSDGGRRIVREAPGLHAAEGSLGSVLSLSVGNLHQGSWGWGGIDVQTGRMKYSAMTLLSTSMRPLPGPSPLPTWAES